MNLDEKTLKQESVYDGKILHVHKDVAEMPDGTNAPREVV